MLSKIQTRFYVGHNQIIKITVRRAGTQAKTCCQRKSLEFPHFTGFLPREQKTLYSRQWTDIKCSTYSIHDYLQTNIHLCKLFFLL
jgi:hypothetical protein